MEKLFWVAADALGSAAKVAEQLVDKSDRYLFLLTLVLLIGGGALFGRWALLYLLRQNEKLHERLQADQECYVSRLQDMLGKYNATNTDLSIALKEFSRSVEHLKRSDYRERD